MTHPAPGRNLLRAAAALAAAPLVLALIFIGLDLAWPLPDPYAVRSFAVAVVDRDGAPLRGFPDDQGVWRYQAGLEDISPLYIEALINYEDRWFRSHPGVNPLALARAMISNLRQGRVVSGGSTLTMQVARILDPHSRTIPGKFKQMFRALQLEFHHSKDEILTLYVNYAPFGGPIEGVQAASYAYLGKSAKEMSHAEAALLAVLPQAPSRLRPDRHPDRATRARDKVLDRMVKFGVWPEDVGREARKERVSARFHPRPMSAPLLARRLKDRAGPGSALKTLIDLSLQQTLSDLLQSYIGSLPPRTSAAALVVENEDLAVRAYVGSADFLDEARFGHVDMVRALRSPGSTLKPFLYAFALEEGLIHSESLLIDAPLSFGGYRPGNFTEGFSGPVSASEALNRSLNIPAVDLLERLGPTFFDARLRQGGLRLTYPSHGRPNLAMILGGVGTSLEDLVAAYTSLARQGLAGRVRFTSEDPLLERRMMSPGAAYIIGRILEAQPRPDLPSRRISMARSRRAAWKTGTSYGYRDAWAVGVTDDYTIGVWVGRPDGTPSPGQYGRATAAPLLFALIDTLPRSRRSPPPWPESVQRAEICRPLGTRPNGENDPLCHERRQAWILNGAVPPSFPDRHDELWLPNPLPILVNPDTGLRVEADCPVEGPKTRLIARWPKAAGPWLSPHQRALSAIPPLDPSCGREAAHAPEAIKITGFEDGALIRPTGGETRLPTVTLSALGGRGRLYWMLDGELIGEVEAGAPLVYQFTRPGGRRLTVIDLAGNYDSLEIRVLAGRSGARP